MMSLRMLVRLSAARASPGIKCFRLDAFAGQQLSIAKLCPFRQREYATVPPSRKKFELPEQYTEEVFHALANNPQVMQGLHNVIEALNRRGITLDQEPNVSEMWKIMRDKNIMQALNDLSKTCDSAGIKLDHILKNIPWSEEVTKWAQTSSIDPEMSRAGVEKRMEAIREILKRPDPGLKAAKSDSGSHVRDAKPVLEEDTTDHILDDEGEMPLGEVQADLRGWWKEGEDIAFYKRLATLKAIRGEGTTNEDIYNLWFEEWTRKVKEIAKIQ